MLHNWATAWESEPQRKVSAQRFCRWPVNPAHLYTTLPRIGLNSQRFQCRSNYILTNLYVCAARNPYCNINYEPISINKARRDRIWMPVCAQWHNRWLASSCPPHILNTWSLWQIINRKHIISANVQSQEYMKYKSWWKLELRKGSFWDHN